jgi:hypothetical protein
MNKQTTEMIEKVRSSFISSLPQRCTCTKCGKKRDARKAFGVRLMNGRKVERKGAEPKFLMQAQCKTCRGAKK